MLIDLMAQNRDIMRWVRAAQYLCEHGTAIECADFFEQVYLFEGRDGSEDLTKSFSNIGYHMRHSDKRDQVKASFLISLNSLFQVIEQRTKIWLTGVQA